MNYVKKDDETYGDVAFFETLYYFKIIYSKICEILEAGNNLAEHPLHSRFDEYYEPFLAYLLESATLEYICSVEDIIKSLPKNTKEETLDEWRDKKSKPSISKGKQQIEILFQEHGANEFPLPQWLNEALTMVNSLINYDDNPDAPIFRKNLSELESKIKQVNQSVESKIVIEQNETATYHSSRGITYTGKIKKGTNPYKLLEYLAGNVGKVYSAAEINIELNSVRQGGVDDPKRRVTDTIKSIRENLTLPTDDDIFIVSNGYGLKYPVIFNA